MFLFFKWAQEKKYLFFNAKLNAHEQRSDNDLLRAGLHQL